VSAVRSFVAVELTESCRLGLAAAIEKLRPVARGVRWVDPRSAHLTLKFIGELPERDVPAAVIALSSAAASAAPFGFRVEGISGFPARGKPRVIHAPVHEPTGELAALAKAVETALSEALGVKREARAFKPHITLGRVKDPRDCPALPELTALVPDADFGEVPVERIVLMRSDLTPRGAIYTPLEHIPLGGA